MKNNQSTASAVHSLAGAPRRWAHALCKNGSRIREGGMRCVFFLCAAVSTLAVLCICLYLFLQGVPAMGEIGVFRFLFGTSWRPSAGQYGILPMIIGTLYVTAGSLLVGVPVGILTAVFFARFCPRWLYRYARPVLDLLAGIPSIVWGMFGLSVLMPVLQFLTGGTGRGLLTASLLLGLMILPTIIGVAESALRAVPDSYYEGALALGATHERAVFTTVLPAAKSGVLAAVVLGIGRAAGETMAVSMIAGNTALIPDSILDPVRTLTTNIMMEMSYSTGLHRRALIATGVVLFVFVMLINLSVSLIRRKEKSK